ncbi:hypothetical protein [Ralstonia phage RP13]|nr:hypothetical protein [Ralstonia phage RP13]
MASEKYWGVQPQSPKMSRSVVETVLAADGWPGAINISYTVGTQYISAFINGRRVLSADIAATDGKTATLVSAVGSTLKKGDEVVFIGDYAIPAFANQYSSPQVDSLLSNKLDVSAAVGRLLNVQKFLTAGTFTYTPTTGTTRILAKMVGAGGGGGGAQATNSSQNSCGGGGGSGAYAELFLTGGFSGQTIITGAAAVNTAGANGNNGGLTSFCGISCAGGAGGWMAINTSYAFAMPSSASMAVSGSLTASGIIVLSLNGNCGHVGILNPAIGTFGGRGADSPLGAGGIAIASGVGGAGTNNGGGGAGSVLGTNGTALAGGQGAPGGVIIYEYY